MTATSTRPKSGDIARWLVEAGDMPITRSEHGDGRWPASDRYVELFWLPFIGCLGWAMLRRLDFLAASSSAASDTFTTSIERLAAECGLPGQVAPSDAPARRLARLIHVYGLVDLTDDGLAVPALVPFLRRHLIARLPEHLRETHPAWEIGR